MNRRPLATVAAAAAAAVAFGVYAPAAIAAPPAKPHAKTQVSKDARLLATQKTNVLREIARKDTALAGVLKDNQLKRLDATQVGTIRANVAADRAALAALRTSVSGATTVAQVRAFDAKVKQVRPEVYHVVVNSVRQAARFLATAAQNKVAIADLTTQADAKETEGFEMTDVRTALDAAGVANAEAEAAAVGTTELALKLTATATHADLGAVRTRLAAAEAALTTVGEQLLAVESALAAMVPTDPTTV
jgi:hypothetical protein